MEVMELQFEYFPSILIPFKNVVKVGETTSKYDLGIFHNWFVGVSIYNEQSINVIDLVQYLKENYKIPDEWSKFAKNNTLVILENDDDTFSKIALVCKQVGIRDLGDGKSSAVSFSDIIASEHNGAFLLDMNKFFNLNLNNIQSKLSDG